MIEIDVQKIVKEIRMEIENKGYKPSDLSFEDVDDMMGPVDIDEYDFEVLTYHLDKANRTCFVPWYEPYSTTGIKTIVKKVIRKATAFFIAPITDKQNEFNTASVRTLNQLKYFAAENEKLLIKIKQLEERIEILEKEERHSSKGDSK